MDAKFTTKSQEALSAAAMNASTAGNPQIEPAHLLKALMDQRESVAVAVLKAAGADPDAVSTAASSAIRRLPSTQGSTVAQPQFSRAALQVVQNARTQAEQRSDEFVSTEHLLLGVAADSGEAGEALLVHESRNAQAARVDDVTLALGEGAGAERGKHLPKGAFMMANDYGLKAFGGAAPPAGDRPHRYMFAVHALDVADLSLDPDDSPTKASFVMLEHTLGRAVLTGMYQA